MNETSAEVAARTSPGAPGGLREEEEGEEGGLIITPIHLRRTPAPIHDGASQRGCRFDESPLKMSRPLVDGGPASARGPSFIISLEP